METKSQDQRNAINEKIREEVFKIEKENYRKKELNTNEMIAKIKKIVEDAVK